MRSSWLIVALWLGACPGCSKITQHGQHEPHPPTHTFSFHLSVDDHSSIVSFTGEQKLLRFIFHAVLLIPHLGTRLPAQNSKQDAIASLHHFALCLQTSVHAIRGPTPFMSLNE